MNAELDREIDRNLYAFLPRIPQLLQQHAGEYALLRNQEVVSVHKRLQDAIQVASERFSDGLFSIQQITDKPVELGFFSYADYQG